jgi:prevent-host-death family protein
MDEEEEEEVVGVRELRQNASALVQKVARGVIIRITNHGHPVARLVPVGKQRASRADLIASGELQPGRGNVLDVEPVAAPAGTSSTEELLAEQRADR